MPKKKHIRVKMRGSLHGVKIAVDPDMSSTAAGEILRAELAIRTPKDTGSARRAWSVITLANGDIRVANSKPYIRRLAIDGSSKKARAGFYNDAVSAARVRINSQGKRLEAARQILRNAPFKTLFEGGDPFGR